MFFYLMFLNIYYLEKLTLSKLVEKVNLLERKFKEYLQLPFVCKTVSRISFKLFCSGDKRLSSEFLGKEIDFRDIMHASGNILAKN